jgi:HK97 gp10 family phage protein
VSTADKFRALTRKLQQEVVVAATAGLNEGADQLVSLMKVAAPVGETGHLRESIRKEPGRDVLQVKVKAGGPLTTKEVRKGSGVPYDYARADEFGTQKDPAHPFFWPSYHLMKKSIRAAVRKTIAKAIKERSAQ